MVSLLEVSRLNTSLTSSDEILNSSEEGEEEEEAEEEDGLDWLLSRVEKELAEEEKEAAGGGANVNPPAAAAAPGPKVEEPNAADAEMALAALLFSRSAAREAEDACWPFFARGGLLIWKCGFFFCFCLGFLLKK